MIYSQPHRNGWGRAALALVIFLTVLAEIHSSAASAADGEAAASGTTEIQVSVPYVTNRRFEVDGPGLGVYSGERGVPSVGRCEVVFTPIPIINQFVHRVPFYIPDETRKVRFERQADAERFWDRLGAEVSRTASRSVVVFVHGYNYDFERHCTVAAELQRTLQYKTTVLMFGWPSNGRPSDYIPDQADVEWSVGYLAQTLTQLAERFDPERVQVLAHSLGSRGAVFALERLRAEREQRPVIGPLILMAPDFDAQAFVERLPALLPLTTGITLYASSNDTPLKVSRQLHASPRLGEAGEFLTVAAGLQTLDVSALGRYQVLGHEYFLFHPVVAADLAALIGDGQGAARRPGLRTVRRNGLIYWELLGERIQPVNGDGGGAPGDGRLEAQWE